jgi:hypothetical protein
MRGQTIVVAVASTVSFLNGMTVRRLTTGYKFAVHDAANFIGWFPPHKPALLVRREIH